MLDDDGGGGTSTGPVLMTLPHYHIGLKPTAAVNCSSLAESARELELDSLGHSLSRVLEL